MGCCGKSRKVKSSKFGKVCPKCGGPTGKKNSYIKSSKSYKITYFCLKKSCRWSGT